LIKYSLDDLRDDKSFTDLDTGRGIICQIQIALALYSDFSSFLTILLLTLKNYEEFRNIEKFFEKKRNRILSILFVVCISIILSIEFLFFDRKDSYNNISYRFDVRDRCTYGCWLSHFQSIICFGLYWIFIIINTLFSCKTNYYLKNKKNSSKEEDNNDISNEIEENNNSQNELDDEKNSEKKRLAELNLLRIKCIIYPIILIIFWLLISIYRTFDDFIMIRFDRGNDPDKGENEEKEFFTNNTFLQILVQLFLVIYAVLSSLRGIIYGLSFIIFEEEILYDFFRKNIIYKLYNNTYPEEKEQGKLLSTNYSAMTENK
jgi:hypothetical protein